MKRLALLSTVLLVLLAACGGEAEPVEDGEPSTTSGTESAYPDVGSVEVTGTISGSVSEPYKEVSGPIVWGSGEGGSVLREQTYTGTWNASDERLSGDDLTVVNCDMSEPQSGDEEYVGECWGTTTLSNEGGTWEGTFEGTSTWTRSEPQHVHDMSTVLVGTGDYEGLQFVGNYTGVNPPWDLTGTIEPVNS